MLGTWPKREASVILSHETVFLDLYCSFSLSAQKSPIFFSSLRMTTLSSRQCLWFMVKSTAPPRISIHLPEMVCFSNSAMSNSICGRCGQPFKRKYSPPMDFGKRKQIWWHQQTFQNSYAKRVHHWSCGQMAPRHPHVSAGIWLLRGIDWTGTLLQPPCDWIRMGMASMMK